MWKFLLLMYKSFDMRTFGLSHQINIFDGLDLVSKEMIENNFNDKKEIKANI